MDSSSKTALQAQRSTRLKIPMPGVGCISAAISKQDKCQIIQDDVPLSNGRVQSTCSLVEVHIRVNGFTGKGLGRSGRLARRDRGDRHGRHWIWLNSVVVAVDIRVTLLTRALDAGGATAFEE